MSYFPSKPFTEQRSGTTEIEGSEDEGDFTLKVTFQYSEWSEGHDYGDTTAYETCSENENEEYELDGESISYDALHARFGDEAQKAIDRAIENAS